MQTNCLKVLQTRGEGLLCLIMLNVSPQLNAGPQAELSQWQSRLAASGREWAVRNRSLRAETHAVRRHCRR